MMDDLANPAEPINGSQKLPAIAIIEDQVLARTCIVNILKRELTGFEIVEMATTSDLNLLSDRDVRLIAFNIGDKQITDPSIEYRLALLEESCPNASIALLSNRDDEATTSAAMQRGVRGFFANSIAVEVALTGLRLVRAGGVYRSRSSDKMKRRSLERCWSIAVLLSCPGPRGWRSGEHHAREDLGRLHAARATCARGTETRPSTKLIAVRLNLSENTIEMHI
jgi:DNA-binding NarL/FixJ family response regulator